jgi:hypothetical protein
MTLLKRGCGLLLAIALVLGLQAVAYAQTGAASITGLVTDQSGAATPGVTVTATNQATNVDYTAVSNQAGSYTITSVPVGMYIVKSALSGFKTTSTKPIMLEAKQIARLDFKMEVGALEDTVEVTAESPVLQTETVTVGEVVSGNTVQSLPLNGRNPGQLALLLTGTMTVNPAGFTNIGAINQNRPYVNGHREQVNNYTLDGLDVNETIDNRVSYQPSPDALAEISVETNNYSADTGNVGGAVISSIIKSGTNQLHGNAFEFFRHHSLNANSWENNRSRASKPQLEQHIFGATLGGPIIQNKLFFFADYQGSRRDVPGSSLRSVAPEAWRKGDLSSLLPGTVVKDPLTGQPFPNNQIPVDRISPTALAILNDTASYPLPNRDVSGVSNNYVGDTLTTYRAHQGDLRLDWSASEKDKLWGRFTFTKYVDETTKNPFALSLGSRNDQPFWNVGFNWSRVFGPSVVNELLVGFSNTKVVAQVYDWGGIGDANATYGIAGGQPVAGLSCITSATGACSGLSGLSALGAIGTDSDTLAKTYQINEKLTWLKGRHALKVGGQFLYYNQRRFYAGNNGTLGFIAFNGSFSGSQFSDFLLDQASGKGRGGGDPNDPWTHLQKRIGLFVQDDFKLKQNLTLNIGLRWAYTSPLVEKDNRQSNFDLPAPFGNGTGQQIFAKDGSLYDRALYHPYYNGWEPRLGVSWSATDRLVLRGGYGISQFMEGTGANLRLPLNPPDFFESNVNYDRTTGAGTIGTGFAELVPGTTPTGNVRAYDPDLRPQFTQQWNAFVEYRVTSSMSAQAGYVAHRANHLVAPVEGNQALPGEGDPSTWPSKTVRRPLYPYQPLITTVATTASRAHSQYDSLQASVRQRAWHGLEFLASYTLGKAYSNNRGYYGAGGFANTEGAYWQNTYDPDAEWGPAFHDIRHNFIFSWNYELPLGKGHKWGSDWTGVTKAILGGWKLSGIFQARTGVPVTVTDGRARSLQGERGSERPNCVGNWKPSNQSVTADSSAPADSRWIDISAFEAAALGTFGNCPVGVARAPGYSNLDLTLSKRFDVGGPRYLELRAEAFNTLNHPNFGPPARDISAPNTFGLITGTVGTPRVIELAVKFYF